MSPLTWKFWVEYLEITGVLWVFLFVLAYIVFFHSRKRWPGTSTWRRCVYIMTFGTPPEHQ